MKNQFEVKYGMLAIYSGMALVSIPVEGRENDELY